ncbi:MAG: DoxX family membrane protein [Alphaproteobacteria bacterium]|jgi:putative oxidoreductase|nr:DoxX family membrane protein [Alphaproteobacteria bacterium]MDE1984894.1 DoxX family membrane protein [Alphaproteobacteria bacterium]MDE2163617.1 DoxX family membrane protein [Alphaproteobacteria bacterium]MDE2266258.1 DoxX family membrane protein [Alphaproteobacteria bacterium]MDE2499383.1 DoxX family membrane protein [Alphaproteobacteria bacterium]
MSISEYLSPLIGRLVLVWFFLDQVAHYGGDWSGTVSLMTFSGVPAAAFVLLVALMLLILGSLSLLFGFHTRHGAVLLFGVIVVATVLMYNFWEINDNASARAADFELFARNVAIAGGLLLLVGMGPGPVALDNYLTGKRKK